MRRGHGRGPTSTRGGIELKLGRIVSAVRPSNIQLPAGEQAVIHSASRGPRHGEISASCLRLFFRDCSTFLPRSFKLTSFPPRSDRKRSARAGGRLRNGPWDVAVPRTSRNRSPPRSRFAPLFAPLFPPFLGRKVVYPLDNLGVSRTNFIFRKKTCIHLSHIFAAFRNFYALESPIAEIL